MSTKGQEAGCQFDITIDSTSIRKVAPHDPSIKSDFQASDIIDARGCLVGPSLCHAHIHLDKCFLLSDPKYADLEILTGDFAEALDLTSKAKARFEKEDLIRSVIHHLWPFISCLSLHGRACLQVHDLRL